MINRWGHSFYDFKDFLSLQGGVDEYMIEITQLGELVKRMSVVY